MKKLLLIAQLIISVFSIINAHYAPNAISIIIDTDCSADDLRAITMFQAIKHAEIEAFIVSEGSLSPNQGFTKINQLINYFQTEIPVGIGKEINISAPSWREMNLSIPWGNVKENYLAPKTDATDILDEVFTNHDHLIYIALGPLTNLYDYLGENPENSKKIDQIIWYCSGQNRLSGFNYTIDSVAAKSVFSKKIPVDIVSLNSDLVFNNELLAKIGSIENNYSNLLLQAFTNNSVIEKLDNNHFKIWDDLIPIYFLYPELFDIKPNIKYPNTRYCSEINGKAIEKVIPDIFSQNYKYIENIVFNEFPMNPDLFRYDLQVNMDSIIQRYGELEWKTCVITNEFHGHLGIYSIVGAKMGIKARETLNAPIDRLEVISFAGSNPPISCFTDGLQVSTGATLGQGTIQLSNEKLKRPEAIFIHNQDTIKMKLKDEYWNIIKDDISKGIVDYGLQSDGYWKFIRKLAIKYWLEFDRNQIFEIKKI